MRIGGEGGGYYGNTFFHPGPDHFRCRVIKLKPSLHDANTVYWTIYCNHVYSIPHQEICRK